MFISKSIILRKKKFRSIDYVFIFCSFKSTNIEQHQNREPCHFYEYKKRHSSCEKEYFSIYGQTNKIDRFRFTKRFESEKWISDFCIQIKEREKKANAIFEILILNTNLHNFFDETLKTIWHNFQFICQTIFFKNILCEFFFSFGNLYKWLLACVDVSLSMQKHNLCGNGATSFNQFYSKQQKSIIELMSFEFKTSTFVSLSWR